MDLENRTSQKTEAEVPQRREQMPEGARDEKQSQWTEKLQKMETLGDGKGRGMDEKIKETVAILQLFDLHTTGSCEGHLERGEPLPWISIRSPEVAKIAPRLRDLKKKLNALKEDDDDFERTKEERNQLWQESDRLTALEFKKLFPYLDEFYQERNAPYDQRLIIDPRGRLAIQGGIIQWGEDLETRARKLAEYQEEMRAFTEFLKQKFFAK